MGTRQRTHATTPRQDRDAGAAFFPRSRVQPRLIVNQPGDVYEREADAVADSVMRAERADEEPVQPGEAPPGVQRACAECEREEQAQRRESGGGGPREAPPAVADAIGSGGRPLDAHTRSHMERRMGHDLGRVRIHDDAVAARSARSIDAVAFTSGDHVVFRQGAYAPGTQNGRRLLAHELAHVVQQRASGSRVMRVVEEDGISETPPRYAYSTHCAWIDWSHAVPGHSRTIIAAVTAASDRLRASGSATPETVSVPAMTSTGLGLTFSSLAVTANVKRPLSADEVLSVALRLFMLQSLGFEALQGYTDRVKSSSFSEEDLTSNMIAFYQGARGFDRARIESICGAWDAASSLERFRGYTFRKSGQFTPLSLPGGGRWPAELSTITPAAPGGPLMDLPQGSFATLASSFTRGLVGYQLITDPNLHIASLAGSGPIDIGGTEAGSAHGPHFDVRPLIGGHDLRCRWVVKDGSDRRYRMLGSDGSDVFRYGTQFDAFVGAPTRAVLRANGVHDATILCRVIVGAEGADASLQRMLELPVRFTW